MQDQHVSCHDLFAKNMFTVVTYFQTAKMWNPQLILSTLHLFNALPLLFLQCEDNLVLIEHEIKNRTRYILACLS